MNIQIKKAIAVSVVLFIALVAYYGSYLPMRKSMIFISTIQSAAGMKTISDFEKGFSAPLDYPSPIGQEELVRNMVNSIVNNIQNIPDPKGVEEIMRYIENYYKPIVERGRGMSFGQDVYILGTANISAFLKTEKQEYLEVAEKYFKQANELGPKRPQGLYGLLDIYKIKGDIESFKKIADQILSQWPNDARTKTIIDQVLKQPILSPAPAKK